MFDKPIYAQQITTTCDHCHHNFQLMFSDVLYAPRDYNSLENNKINDQTIHHLALENDHSGIRLKYSFSKPQEIVSLTTGINNDGGHQAMHRPSS